VLCAVCCAVLCWAAVVPVASVRPYLNVLAGVASAWRTLNTTAVAPASYVLPFFPATANVSVTGTVGVYGYLSNNCTSSLNTALVPLLSFSASSLVAVTTVVKVSRRGKNKTATTTRLVTVPYTDMTVFGYAFAGET
jgi:hypothetical protein